MTNTNDNTTTGTPTKVQLYFDVTCPFAWVTSRWMLEVEKVRDIDLEFVPMSLSVLNEGRDLDPGYMDMMTAAWAPALVAAAIYEKHPDKIADYYTFMGEAIHNEKRADKQRPDAYDDLIKEAVTAIGLPSDFLDGVGIHPEDANAYLDQLKTTHEQGLSLVGDEVGTPIIARGGRGFFGPVLTRIPKGEIAGELFDASVTLGNYPHFFEIKRTRTEGPKAEYDEATLG